MGLETGTYINDLVVTNPVGGTDQKAQGDDHLRLIKTVLKNTFPGLASSVTFSAFGISLVDDADAVAARTTLGAASTAAASETVAGLGELATQAETNTGTDDLRIVTPLKLHGLTNGLTELTAVDTAADFVPIYDASATAMRKAKPQNLGAAFPRSYLAGFGLANNGVDATNDIDIAVGACRDLVDAANIVLASALVKQLDVNWVVGTNQGMLDTGAVGNNTYHLWAIRRSDTGIVDILASLSASAPTMPASYDQRRRVGSIMRVAGVNVAFVQDGDLFQRNATILDVTAANPGTAAVTRTLSVPTGINALANVQLIIVDTTASGNAPVAGYLSDLAVSDEAAVITSLADAATGDDPGTDDAHASVPKQVRTNTSAQIRSRISVSAASISILIRTLGWIDRRGRNA